MADQITGGDFTDDAIAAWHRVLPRLDLSPLEVIMRLRRTAIVLAESADKVIAEHGLQNYGDYELLSAVCRSEVPLTPASIATRLLVTRSGMTGRLDRLERAGLLERTPNPEDSRSVFVSLTDSGRETTKSSFLSLVDHNRRALLVLSASQQADLAQLLQALLKSLNDR